LRRNFSAIFSRLSIAHPKFGLLPNAFFKRNFTGVASRNTRNTSAGDESGLKFLAIGTESTIVAILGPIVCIARRERRLLRVFTVADVKVDIPR